MTFWGVHQRQWNEWMSENKHQFFSNISIPRIGDMKNFRNKKTIVFPLWAAEKLKSYVRFTWKLVFPWHCNGKSYKHRNSPMELMDTLHTRKATLFFAWRYVTISTGCIVQKQKTCMSTQVGDEVVILGGALSVFTKQGNTAKLFLAFLNGHQNWLQHKH